MKMLKICGWILLAISVTHGLVGLISGEFQYPSMRANWLTVLSAGGLVLSAACFLALAPAKRAKRKN